MHANEALLCEKADRPRCLITAEELEPPLTFPRLRSPSPSPSLSFSQVHHQGGGDRAADQGGGEHDRQRRRGPPRPRRGRRRRRRGRRRARRGARRPAGRPRGPRPRRRRRRRRRLGRAARAQGQVPHTDRGARGQGRRALLVRVGQDDRQAAGAVRGHARGRDRLLSPSLAVSRRPSPPLTLSPSLSPSLRCETMREAAIEVLSSLPLHVYADLERPSSAPRVPLECLWIASGLLLECVPIAS